MHSTQEQATSIRDDDLVPKPYPFTGLQHSQLPPLLPAQTILHLLAPPWNVPLRHHTPSPTVPASAVHTGSGTAARQQCRCLPIGTSCSSARQRPLTEYAVGSITRRHGLLGRRDRLRLPYRQPLLGFANPHCRPSVPRRAGVSREATREHVCDDGRADAAVE